MVDRAQNKLIVIITNQILVYNYYSPNVAITYSVFLFPYYLTLLNNDTLYKKMIKLR